MSVQDNKAIVRRYYEEIGNQRQLAVADEIFGPLFRLFPNSPPPYGPEGVKQFITWLCITSFPDLRIVIEDLIAEADSVAARITLHGTQTTAIDFVSGFGTIPPTGRQFMLPEFHLWRVTEGKIVERHVVMDQLSMLRDLAVLPLKT